MSKHTGPLSSILGGMYHETFLPTEQDREAMHDAIIFLETIPDNVMEKVEQMEELIIRMKQIMDEYHEFTERMSSAKPIKYPDEPAIPDDWHNRLDYSREERDRLKKKGDEQLFGERIFTAYIRGLTTQ